LPFYWNLNRLPNIVGKHPYTEIDGNYENPSDKINDVDLYNESEE
jgi:hypothetical protein